MAKRMFKRIDNVMSLKHSKNVYICNECNRIVQLNYMNIVEFKVVSETKKFEIDSVELDFHVKCSNCDCYMYKCDPRLAERIRDLNSIGIETLYCCDGHFNRVMKPFYKDDITYRITTPYIAFSKELDFRIVSNIKNMTNLQEYSFISFEEACDDCDLHIIRGNLYDKGFLELDSSRTREEINNISEDFNAMQSKFFEFVDEIIDMYKDFHY